VTKLNLGANDRAVPGFLSVDIVPPADVVADLSQAWPWEDSSVEEIVAYDVFEHIADKRHSMNEAWRVLRPGGRLTIEVPSASKLLVLDHQRFRVLREGQLRSRAVPRVGVLRREG
jgi:predicted SAM-dependent methyltransferase